MNIEPSITQLLLEWSSGKQEALEKLMPLVYQELRRIASNYLRKEDKNHTLQPTALVNEAFIRLVDQQEVKWQNRSHFFAIAAKMMRRVLVNYAEAKYAEKRGGTEAQKIQLDETINFFEKRNLNLLEIDQALDKLSQVDPELCQLVEMKFFGGLTNEEISEVLQISLSTVKREWSTAKTWLLRELSQK